MKEGLRIYLVLLVLLLITAMSNVALGAVTISPTQVAGILGSKLLNLTVEIGWPSSFEIILLQVRLPHTVLIAITGAALAGSGAAYQGLFRNPLADPYVIGVASGAGLGAVIALTSNWPQDLLGYYLIPLAAFAGAVATVLIVYNLARISNYVPLTTLILAGVAVGAFTSSLTSFFMLRANELVIRALAFLLGGSPVSGWEPVIAILPYTFVGLILLGFSGHPLNVLQFGEEQAKQMGLKVERTKFFIITAASLTTAVAVSFSGVIGFIGLIVPHLLRLIAGPDYRRLIPLSILGGAAALLAADTIARILLAPQTLPVGIVTALAGAPFFLWILRRAKQEVFW